MLRTRLLWADPSGMSHANPADKRRHLRHPLTGELSGSLVSKQSGSVIPCVAVDVSINGLRVILTLDLEPGSDLILRLNGKEVPLTVVWSMKEATRKGYFSCGLMSKSPHDNLEILFMESGMIAPGG